MIIQVTGGRKWSHVQPVRFCLEHIQRSVPYDKLPITLIHGDALGLDTIAKNEAHFLGMNVISIPANWAFYKKPAGAIRNDMMLKVALMLDGYRKVGVWPQEIIGLAFHENIGWSKGTKDMIKKMKAMSIPYLLIHESTYNDRAALDDLIHRTHIL